MHALSAPSLALLASFASIGPLAQQAVSPSPSTAQAAAIQRDLRVPIHTHPDDPTFGPYGVWAMGPDYKVSFHDGFVFYPRLGAAYPENLPLAWHTESVTAGGEVLASRASESRHRHSDWRYELHYPGVVEAYDVRADGVEQTFVLRAPPATAGDWVVTGRITTRLVAAPTLAAAQQDLLFTDAAGRPLVRYGAATAIDARGDRLPVTTTFDGERIRLTVAGAWLARASFPVVLDPLTAPVTIHVEAATARIFGVDIGQERESQQNNVMVVFTRRFSGSDSDVFGLLMNSDFSQPSLVFSDVPTGIDSLGARVAFVGGADRWVIAFTRRATSGTVTQVRLWVHDKGVASSAGGSMMFLPVSTTGATDRNPDVGGVESNQTPGEALVVFQSDITSTGANTVNTETRGVRVNAVAKTAAASFVLSANGAVGTRYDRENPAVNKIARATNDAWMVVWQDRDHSSATPRWRLARQYIGMSGPPGQTSFLSSSRHLMQPRVDGNSHRYAVVYFNEDVATAGAPTLWVNRFDFTPGPGFTHVNTRAIAFAPTGMLITEPRIAFDTSTRSHWCATYGVNSFTLKQVAATRLGTTGGTVEQVNVVTSGEQSLNYYEGAVTFAGPEQVFLIAHTASATSRIVGRRLAHDPAARNTGYGIRCSAAGIGGNVPNAGLGDWHATLFNAPPSTVALLFLGFAPTSLDLGWAGMPGCALAVDPSVLVQFNTTTTASGNAAVNVPLPDNPVFLGDLYFQWFYLAPGANAANLLATNGMMTQVRV